MNTTLALRIASLLGFLAVALGAFGAHGLHSVLSRNEAISTWQTAVFYHFVHAIMLYVLALRPRFHPGPWFAFLLGVLIFSGSLYVLAITNIKWLGAITPFGGVSFIIGWLWLMISPRAVNA